MVHSHARIGKDRYRTEIVVGVHRLASDEPEAAGGADSGPAPYDLLLAALGACTAMTLRMYADRKQWPLVSAEVDLQLTRDANNQRRIERTLTLVGLDGPQCARMADIAERTPVTLTLKAGLPISTRLA